MSQPLTLQLLHDTRYDYDAAVAISQHLAWLQPLSNQRQLLEQFALEIEPAPPSLSLERDHFGNLRHRFALYQPHTYLQVRAQSLITLLPQALARPQESIGWQSLCRQLAYQAGVAVDDAVQFVFASPRIPLLPELQRYARDCFDADTTVLQGAIRLMQRIHGDFLYAPYATEAFTPILQAFHQRAGVCQDFAQIMIGCLRALGLPARYVSGYLLTQPAPGCERLVGADASHAWVSVYCPPLGWVDLDPTNNLLPQQTHVTLAIGRDFSDVTPLRGVLQGCAGHRLSVAVTLAPLAESALPAPLAATE